MTIAKAIAKAWTDDAYKAKLLDNPHVALSEVGVDIPADTSIKMIENTADTTHIVLPVAPVNAVQLSPGELEKIAGGAVVNPQITD